MNCPEGCNLGTGCAHEKNIFEINTVMDKARQNVLRSRDKADFDLLFEEYDRKLQLGDFIRRYTPAEGRSYDVTAAQIEDAFIQLGKENESARKFDCSACGANTCHDMAKQIAAGLNTPRNCIQKTRDDVHREHDAVLELSIANNNNIKEILEDISKIKTLSGDILQNISDVNAAVEKYSEMGAAIDRIAMQINIISLNASIEAARAGQHGKAFSVVAEEIRRLASTSKDTVSETQHITEQTMDSIKSITTIIDSISSEVEKAYQNISDISVKTQEALVKSEI